MHKRKLKRNTLTQNVKSENLSRVKDYQNNQNESSDNFQLPSLQKKKTWKDVDDNLSTDWNSNATDIFCSSEIENIATRKVMQQWETIENTLYEDGEQVTQTAVLEECIQWKTQIPHLRIIGKNPFLSKSNYQDLNINHNQMKNISHNEDTYLEHNISIKKTAQDEILDMLYAYVISELFPKKENEIDSLHDDFNDVLQIRMASIHSNKSSAKSSKINWFEETIPLENKFSNNSGKSVEDHILSMRKDVTQTNMQEIQKKYDNFMNNDRIRNEKDEFIMDDKFSRPHTSRNKLGTVFNEKIVVSPVPYVLSTRESFSTIRTTPIKFMAQSLEVSTFQSSNKNINYFKNSEKNSKISNYQSSWHTPVSPAVWVKNVKLAPLDMSRLPNSKNRSLTSSVVLSRNKKPLSPISRSSLPVSAQTIHNNYESLEIQGKQITPRQSPKLNMSTTSLENISRNSTKKKKRSQTKTKL
ncbi:uncharacterized protein LOC122710628 isoform X3 [Apis laboriosa]|uniref:uncharacterized protein LOC122710628 isoform X3 n=1 Tax=Apis laboriosa TaxID=183418 RepID=UPI001CC33EFD|nr:uncharacterized protein LOC122710628 isoform X3 [Apis laboriosa]